MSKSHSIRTVLICIALAASFAAQARTFVPVGIHRGVEARVVPAIVFDQRGYLWIGSREGLFRFDGHETRHFLPDSSHPDAISDIDIRALFVDSAGRLWIGTHTGGLDRYDPADASFVHYRHDPGDSASLGDAHVTALAEGPDGQLWVGTHNGLSRLVGAARFERFRHNPERLTSLSNDEITDLHLGTSGNLWIATAGGGVNRWNAQSGDFTRFDLALLTGGPAERNTVLSLQEDARGILWCGTRAGLVRLEPHSARARSVYPAGDGPAGEGSRVVTAMQTGPRGRLWAATQEHGLYIIDDDGQGPPLSFDAAGSSSGTLPVDALMSLAMGHGRVFVGTWGSGVYRAPLQENGFALLDMDRVEGLNNNVITAVMATARDGYPWLGSYGGGPQQADVGTAAIRAVPGRLHRMRESGVLSLGGPVDGRLYAGTNHGLYEFSTDGTQMALFEHQPGLPNGIGPGYVTALLADGEAGLWLGLGGSGLQYFEARSQVFTPFHEDPFSPDALGSGFVTALLGDRDGTIWVGTRTGGLSRCSTANRACARVGGLSHTHVTALYRDRTDGLWVTTDGGGLNQLRVDDGQVSVLRDWTESDGLLDNRLQAIVADLDDSLWLSSRQGLSRLQPATGRVENFVPETGLPVGYFSADAAAADGRYIYFGSANGLLYFPKGMAWQPRVEPLVRITGVELTGGESAQLPGDWQESGLRLPYGRVFSVILAVLDYTEAAHRYVYRFRPSDPWTDMGTQRQVIVHGLEPGRYVFQARGRAANGFWGEAEPLALEIVPPFWMTWWFRGGLLALLIAMALMTHFTRQAVLQRRADKMLQLGEQREKALEEQLGDAAELAVLTPRQKEILQLIAEGYTTREIAELLRVSNKTVEAHRANLMERLDIHDIPGLVRLAIRTRLVSMDG